MIVMKFGGSSVADAQRIRHVASIITSFSNKKPIVVLSAMGDTTDDLLAASEEALNGNVNIDAVEKLHRETAETLGVSFSVIEPLLSELRTLLTGVSMLRELSPRSRDYLVSFGERLSVRLMAEYLSSINHPAVYYDAWDIGMRSDSNFMSADLLPETWDNIKNFFSDYGKKDNDPIPVVTGFIAKDEKGEITTLGRGGSDLSATIIGAALNVEEVQTWKDVDGIMSADPRIVKNAHTVPVITYDEAAELAYFGAQVLHPRSMQPCLKTGTPVRVKNSYNIDSLGTRIIPWYTERPAHDVRAITAKKNVTLIDIVSTRMVGQSGFLSRVFDVFEECKISVDVVATSEVSISLTVDGDAKLDKLKELLEKVASVNIKEKKAIITVICDITKSSSILAKAFNALAEQKINIQMLSQGASKVNVSMICNENQVETVLTSLHSAFFEK